MDASVKIKAKIAALRDEISDWEVTLRKLEQLGNEGLTPCVNLNGKNIIECARAVLQANGNSPLHYKDIVKQALEKGYKGSKNKHPVEAAYKSFAQTMRREKTIFKGFGDGRFELLENK